MSRLLTILLAICLCVACSPAATPPAPTATQRPEPTATLEPTALVPTPSPQPSPTPTPQKITLTYKVVYQQDGFTIREAFLGKSAIWQWDNFPMPPDRIKNTVQSLGLGRKMTCDKQSTSNTPCSQTLALPLANGGANEYTLRLANINGGSGLLMKNGKIIWTGITNGANSFAVISSKQIGDEIVLEYSKSNWGSTDQALWVTTSILLTKEKTVVLFPDAFAPNAVDGKLIYFRMISKKEILIFGGQPVGETYNAVFNLLCCWRGPLLEIASDGKIVDFFAQKDNGWYHVQAGYLAEEK
ncbi:MAG: hypothetical protein WA821_04650 [Anaerolineales bacterium]